MARSSRPRLQRWITGGLALASAVVLFRCASSGPAATASASRPAPPRDEPAAPIAAAQRPSIDPLDEDMLSSRSLREALANYERDSIYPPTSHRWSEEQAGEWTPWNRAFPVEHLLDDTAGRETVVRFAADRHHVEYREALISTIEVSVAGRPAERLPVAIRSAIVEAAGAGRTGIVLAYRDDGRDGDAVAGDHIYTNRFVPAEQRALSTARAVRMQVDLEAGGVERLVNLDFTYTPRLLLALVDAHGDVRDGSLSVDLELDVLEPGAYELYADVLASDGVTPIGWITDTWRDLAPGRTRVELTLFGKVLRDRGIPGPYVIANLHAERRATDREAAMWWSDPRTIRTRPISLDELSSDPWDSEERSSALAAMRQAIVEQERVERGAP